MIHDLACLSGGLRRSVLLAALIVLCSGCTAPAERDMLSIASDRYETAFDAAVEAARANGLTTALRDRRSGIIETEPAPAPSLLEPWHDDGSTLATRMDNTAAYQRRIARFEFTPAGFAAAGAGEEEELLGPDVLGLQASQPDLTQLQGPLELRVWVYVERAHNPGLRRDTWSRRNTSRARIIEPDGDGRALPATFWTPVARDRDFERRLLAAISRTLDEP